MNKQILIVAAVLVVTISGGGAYLMLAAEDNDYGSTATQSIANNNSQTAITNNDDVTRSSAAGIYTDYSAEALVSTRGTKILFFHAPWCPQCRALEADIKNSNIPSGVTIFKVDYDSNQELKKKFGVTLQTTLVSVDDNGNMIKKFVAYSEPTFDSLKTNLL